MGPSHHALALFVRGMGSPRNLHPCLSRQCTCTLFMQSPHTPRLPYSRPCQALLHPSFFPSPLSPMSENPPTAGRNAQAPVSPTCCQYNGPSCVRTWPLPLQAFVLEMSRVDSALLTAPKPAAPNSARRGGHCRPDPVLSRGNTT